MVVAAAIVDAFFSLLSEFVGFALMYQLRKSYFLVPL